MNKFDLQLFSEAIKAKRKEENKSLRVLAKELDINFTSLYKYEQSEMVPGVDIAVKICSWLGKKVDYFVKN